MPALRLAYPAAPVTAIWCGADAALAGDFARRHFQRRASTIWRQRDGRLLMSRGQANSGNSLLLRHPVHAILADVHLRGQDGDQAMRLPVFCRTNIHCDALPTMHSGYGQRQPHFQQQQTL